MGRKKLSANIQLLTLIKNGKAKEIRINGTDLVEKACLEAKTSRVRKLGFLFTNTSKHDIIFMKQLVQNRIMALDNDIYTF